MSGSARPVPPGYEMLRTLGSGGFGEVVLARQVRLGRLVAIKRIHESALADDEALARFRREATVLAALSSPHIVRVYDLHVSDDVAQLVMEYVPGSPLSDHVEQGPVPAHEALPALRDVADALAAASAAGVVHRDVKPGNVFVLPSKGAKLGDFGLARVVTNPDVFRTRNGPAIGTPAYFAPELSQGLAEPDAYSDAYSFAVMAYEVLTGRLPVEGEDAISLITAHWSQEPTDPARVVDGFPPAAADALLAGLAKAPTDRPLPVELVRRLTAVPAAEWPDVSGLRSARQPLRRRAEPTVRRTVPPARPPVPASDRRRRRRPGRGVVTGTVLGVVVAAAAAVLGVGAARSGPDVTLDVRAVEVTAEPGRGSCPRTEFVLTALIRTNGEAGSIALRWSRPDGGTTPVRRVDAVSGRPEVLARLRFDVSGSRPLTGDAVVHVLRPVRASARTEVRYECAAGAGGDGG